MSCEECCQCEGSDESCGCCGVLTDLQTQVDMAEEQADKYRKVLQAVLLDAVPCEESENPKQYCVTDWAIKKVREALGGE